MAITATKLRADIYNILDEVLKTGKPIEIMRDGKKLILAPSEPVSKLSRLKKHKCIVGDPMDIVSIDWSKYWKPTL